ncbi:hypothetical protein BASA81_016514 [Batrachochytrium salamandrivorans]|nr:hypothetical protein BASA81_016514 [Batrachochytrium salamandrivorans]
MTVLPELEPFVLRELNKELGELVICTSTTSNKWLELSKDSRFELCVYFPEPASSTGCAGTRRRWRQQPLAFPPRALPPLLPAKNTPILLPAKDTSSCKFSRECKLRKDVKNSMANAAETTGNKMSEGAEAVKNKASEAATATKNMAQDAKHKVTGN